MGQEKLPFLVILISIINFNIETTNGQAKVLLRAVQSNIEVEEPHRLELCEKAMINCDFFTINKRSYFQRQYKICKLPGCFKMSERSQQLSDKFCQIAQPYLKIDQNDTEKRTSELSKVCKIADMKKVEELNKYEYPRVLNETQSTHIWCENMVQMYDFRDRCDVEIAKILCTHLFIVSKDILKAFAKAKPKGKPCFNDFLETKKLELELCHYFKNDTNDSKKTDEDDSDETEVCKKEIWKKMWTIEIDLQMNFLSCYLDVSNKYYDIAEKFTIQAETTTEVNKH